LSNFLLWWEQLKADFITCFVTKERWRYITRGLGNTLKIALVAVLIGIAIGSIVAIVRSAHDKNIHEMRPGLGRTLLKIANAICKVYLTVIRGTPVMIQLLIMFFVIFTSARNGVPVAMLCFGINSGAYVAEIIRAGIMSVDNGQSEAGRSLGLNFVQTMWYIVIPQALKNTLPALANEFIVLLKETSVACYVAVNDLTRGGEIIRGATYQQLLPLLAVAIITVNGHSYEDPSHQTENTNFALLVAQHFSEPFKDSNGYGESIARLSNMLGGGVIIQRFGDLIRGRRSTPERMEGAFITPTLNATPGDLSLVLPKRILDDIVEMIYALDKIAPGTANEDTLLYGVEVKFYNMEVEVNKKLESNQHPGLYIIGDGSGITHSLSHASASGVYVARNILE
jgi:His/Glu/Gln/Arg/opine family amino acid ABC transporter permease subunit